MELVPEITLRASRFSNKDRCAVAGCYSAAKSHVSLIYHNFPKQNMRFMYRPGTAPDTVEKVDMHDVWKSVTGIKTVNSRTKVCSLHFADSDYTFGDSLTKKTLRKTVVPSRKLPDPNSLKRFNDLKASISHVLHDGHKTLKVKLVEDQIVSDKPAKISILPRTNFNKICPLPKYIKTAQELEISTGLWSFSILNSIVRVLEHKFNPGSEIITPKNRVILTYVKLKQNLDFNFLAILFNCGGAEQCEEIFLSTLKMLSQIFKASISLPLYEEISASLPNHIRGIKVILDCVDVIMQGHDNFFSVIIGSSLGGIISYISEPYEKDECNEDVLQNIDVTKVLKPDDNVMCKNEISLEVLCRINKWECIEPRTETEQEYLGRFDERIRSFAMIESVIPDRYVPFIKEIFTVIGGTLNMSVLGTKIPVDETD